jgi:diadenosine tetraphosphatase ApaH/serine/threonine PP2A family protein phosphatase
MRLALLSDIHANIQALDACLAHARARGARQFAFIGDLVGYGANPQAVLAQVQALAQQGAWVIKGNHDEMAVAPQIPAVTPGQQSALWTHAQLTPELRHYLTQLPLSLRLGECLLVHASADEPAQWNYVKDSERADASLSAAQEAAHVLVGHVHMQSVFGRCARAAVSRYTVRAGQTLAVPRTRQWHITVGSVGQPRDGDPRAMYAILDTVACEVSFERVAYDVESAAAAIVRAGLPTFFAERLAMGR